MSGRYVKASDGNGRERIHFFDREETAHHRTGSEWKETHGTGLQRRAREARGVERTIFRNSQTNKGLERNEADRRALAGTG